MSSNVEVNEHYVDHVVALSESSEIQASEDIVAGNGLKLVAKGGRIDARVRQRLLEHKLTKPLESLMQVVDSVATRRIDRIAAALLERHPLLSGICGEASARLHMSTMNHLIVTPQLDSLLSVYAAQGEGKLEHAVGVALLSAALAEDLHGQNVDPPTLMLAGLMHDIGELYIDPALLRAGQRLTPQQWKHIASHPIIGARVLRDMPGAGTQVAQCVLHHHERLDGFGYPRGLADEDFLLPNQLLAVAEWLAGLLDHGPDWLMRATVASRLIPGEFSPRVLEPIHKALRGTAELSEWMASQHAALGDEVVARMRAPQGFGAVQQWIATRGVTASPALRGVMLKAYQRLHRLQASFVGAGLNLDDPDLVQADLGDPEARLELAALVAEFGWRVRELERACLLRAALLGEDDLSVVNEMLEMFRSE